MTWSNHHSTLRSQYSNRPQFRRNSRPGPFGRSHHYRDLDNLKWVKFVTVCGYVFFVSSPAAYLSYYYTCKWDPTYVNARLAEASKKAEIQRVSRNNTRHSVGIGEPGLSTPYMYGQESASSEDPSQCSCTCTSANETHHQPTIGLSDILSTKVNNGRLEFSDQLPSRRAA